MELDTTPNSHPLRKTLCTLCTGSRTFFADRILLIIMTMKSITLFWMRSDIFFNTVNDRPALFTLCIVLTQTSGRVDEERNETQPQNWCSSCDIHSASSLSYAVGIWESWCEWDFLSCCFFSPPWFMFFIGGIMDVGGNASGHHYHFFFPLECNE